ncbi:MAG: amidohydrolase family protein [Magnetospirillum sp.]|nr:amidohydrolase family protein [Magnetospirillum sp.]
MIIHNCHVHLFTLRHVPKEYHQWITTLLKFGPVRAAVLWVLRNIWPFSGKDLAERLAKFAEVGLEVSQEAVFNNRLKDQYPQQDARFVVLPMDMAGMGYGAPLDDINSQHEELAALSQKTGGRVLPFVHFDPRRPNALACIRYWIEERNFKGVKIYPPLGYRPTAPELDPIFAYCAENDVPVMTHCSGATVRAKRYAADIARAAKLAAPLGYQEILDKYPNLRLCLAHFGGERAWDAYMRDPRGTGEFKDEPTKNWLWDIVDMLRNPANTNLYADISYTMFHLDSNIATLAVLLEDQRIRDRTLFGSDFYMSKMEKLTEKEYCYGLRKNLRPGHFDQIADTNPRAYLGSRLASAVVFPAPAPAPVPQAPNPWP